MIPLDPHQYHQDSQQLQRQLQTFLDQARENELKMQRFHEQELRLIGARSLSNLVKNILYNYRNEFALDAVSLLLYDPQYEIHRILEEEGIRLDEHPGLIFTTDRSQLDQQFGRTLRPQLGDYHAQEHRYLFGDVEMDFKSVALLPLVRYGELIGSFNLGSISPDRFAPNSATDFLQRLSTVVAICLENAANHERLKRVGLTDSLTGINNRRFFDQRLGEEVARGLRTLEPLSCLFLDIDYFKKVNDEHGHHAGDHILRQVAGLTREQLRNCDVLGRYGGEEFVALLANTDPSTAMEIAERIRVSIALHEFTLPDSQTPQIIRSTISIGVASLNTVSAETVSAEKEVRVLGKELVKRADEALYRAKDAGRNRVMLAENKRMSAPEPETPEMAPG